jgi:hypothetical protein
MNDSEFEKFLKSVFVAFPDIWEWVRQLPDGKATMATWKQSLRSCTLAECALILDDWIEARTPAPRAYERSLTATMIRSAVEQQRAIDRRKEIKVDAWQYAKMNAEEKRRAREDYQPLPGRPDTRGMDEEALQLRLQMVDGKITRDELMLALGKKREARLKGANFAN